jgi:hypothetical protein
MKNIILSEIKEFKTKDQHLDQEFNAKEDILAHEKRLIELSKRKASGFSIEGKLPILELKFGSFNGLFATLFVIFIGFFVTVALTNLTEPIYTFIPILIFIIAILYAKFGNTTNKITIDCSRKTLKIESNHWLGKYLGGKVFVPFSSITSLDSKLKKYHNNKGIDHERNRVILNTATKKYQLFEIPYRPIYYVNEKLMIQSIMEIIKNAA